ncbi:phage tail sheath N-terminal beta-sandwich domain-containing protein, partial [Streptococcus pneumoniae]|uniref:phage tail sheath N-terminal beta-sandwich domain-containing protein n=1 Tax=Streptococcus pneumoniae TaxID=1313 RepID=UPI0018B0B95B
GFASATNNLVDAGAGVSLVATAKSPGAWGNSLNVAVPAGVTGGTFIVTVTHDTDTTISEVSPELADQAAAIAWAEAASDYIILTLGATALDPAVAAYSLASGSNGAAVVSADLV